MQRPPKFPKTRGQSLVEFALVVPILFAMLFIIVELGIIFSVYVGLTNSAREAARAGSAYQFAGTTTCPTTSVLSPALISVDCERELVMDDAIMRTLSPIIAVNGVNDLNPASGDRYTYQTDPPTLNSYRYGDKVTVTLAYTHRLFFNLLGPASLSLRTSSEMRLEPGGS